jgi:hypothetical protein
MIVEHPHETARLKALLDEIENAQRRRMSLAWAEIRAERIAREERIMACVRPTIEDTQNDPA